MSRQEWRHLVPAETRSNKERHNSTAKCGPACRSHLRSRSPRALQSGQFSSLCESPNPLFPCPVLADGEGEEQFSARNCCGCDFHCHVGLNGDGTEPATKTLVDEAGIGMNIEWNGLVVEYNSLV